jgi:CRP/FNR family transcriptional regulator, cyclic AMP receptor protein
VAAEIAAPETFFADRDERDWDRLLAYTETRRFRPGEVVLPDGVADRALYLLADGRLEVIRPGARSKLATIEAPATIGEAEFLDGRPRSVALRALGHGEIERLSWESFEALSAREPQFARDILVDVGRVLASRLRAGAGSVGF